MVEKPFKNREEVKHEISLCDKVGSIFTYACILFAALGVIGDAANLTLGLETTSWFLLAIVTGLIGINPNMHTLLAKHLFGIESELKKE